MFIPVSINTTWRTVFNKKQQKYLQCKIMTNLSCIIYQRLKILKPLRQSTYVAHVNIDNVVVEPTELKGANSKSISSTLQ